MRKKIIHVFPDGKLKDTIKIILEDPKLLIYFGVLLFSSFLFLVSGDEKTIKDSKPDRPIHLSTMIPQDQSLVPIEIEMSEKLDSMIGQFAKVNLYLNSPSSKNRMIAEGVKLLRSPKNPSIFAVLVPHQYIKWFMGLRGRFVVSIANQDHKAGTFFVKKNKGRRKIQYGVEDDPYKLNP